MARNQGNDTPVSLPASSTCFLILNSDNGNAQGGWNGGDDSFYEYLLKMYVYDSSRFSNYSERWVLAADSAMEHLASHPSSRPQLTFLASFVNTSFVNTSEHLTCFDGGSFLLGGQVFGRQEYIDFGLGQYPSSLHSSLITFQDYHSKVW